MPERSAALTHLLRGLEELCCAAADGLRAARSQLEAEDGDSIAGAAEPALVAALREALAKEQARWAARAASDAEAAKLRDLCAFLRSLLEDAARTADSPPGRRRGPRRTRGEAPRADRN